MADYRIFETAAFLRELADLPSAERERIRSKLVEYVYPQLRISPRNHPQARRLLGYLPPKWRWRLGEWRAFYNINDEERLVSMTALKLRRDAY